MNSSRQLALWVLLIFAATTLVTATWGWTEHFFSETGKWRIFDALYLALLAFTGDETYIHTPNALTATARFTGLVTTISALIGVAAIFLGEQVKRLRARRKRHHQVMVGVSEFALDYTSRQGSVTVFDTKDALSSLAPRSRPTLRLVDRMNDRTATGASLGQRPDAVIFGAADTVTNVERARIWLSGVPPERRQETNLVLRIEDNSVARDLHLLGDDFEHATLISRSETIARALVTGMAPTALATLRDQERVHVALMGLGSVNLAVAEQLALRCHHPNLRALRLTVIDQAPDAACARIRAERPDLFNPDFRPDGLQIEFLELDGLECCAENRAADLMKLEAELPLTAIVVAAGEDTRNVAIAMRLRRLQLQHLCLKAPIFMRSDSLASIAPQPFNDLTGGIVPFGGRRLDAEDVELERIYNGLAEEIHSIWRDNLPADEKTEGNLWKNMPTAMRRPSYRAAMSSVEIFYAAGFVPTGGTSLAGLRLERSVGNQVLGDEQLIEDLARTEHTRWVAERRLEGYQAPPKGAPRDNEKKLHPLMVPYAELPVDQPVKDERNVKSALTLGLERQEAAEAASCWRKVVRLGVIGPLGVKSAPSQDAAKALLDKIAEKDSLLPQKALEIVTPNAPGYDRLAALAIAEAWMGVTGRPCSILELNAASPAYMDIQALKAVDQAAFGLDDFREQTQKLAALQARGCRSRKLDLRLIGQSDADFSQTPELYDGSILRAQDAIMHLADYMVFDALDSDAQWTRRAIDKWRNLGKEPLEL